MIPDSSSIDAVFASWLGYHDAYTTDILLHAERIACSEKLNILGAAFLAGIELISIQWTALCRVMITDADILRPIYPDFPHVLANDDKVSRSVRSNNTGTFAIYAAYSQEMGWARLSKVLTDLKYGYRSAVNKFVPRRDPELKHHMIHIPMTLAERRIHMEIFYGLHRACNVARFPGSVLSAWAAETDHA